MTKYNVHLYREMRLMFDRIEAGTPEAAAAIAREMPTRGAVEIDDCEGITLSALVDVDGDEEYEHSVLIDFEEESQRKATPALLAACRLVVARWEHGDLAEAARACGDAIAKATATCPPREANESYSVLLLYPDYADDTGYETYYALVEASDPIEAVTVAQREAVAAQSVETCEPTDFSPLLVTQGHHYSEPLFNK